MSFIKSDNSFIIALILLNIFGVILLFFIYVEPNMAYRENLHELCQSKGYEKFTDIEYYDFYYFEEINRLECDKTIIYPLMKICAEKDKWGHCTQNKYILVERKK